MPVRNDGIVCQECGGSGCSACNQSGYSKSYYLEHPYRGALRRIIIVCEECEGSGCSSCNESGYLEDHYDEAEGYIGSKHEDDTVPMPYGKILPDLTDCFYINEDKSEPEDEDYDEILDKKYLCPNCNSDNIVILDKEANPDVAEEQEILAERFFCITCQDSWCYERER